jgi:translation initiation factor 5B
METHLRPVCITIVGNVDTGKTTLADKIRESKVASHEAGSITQNIGATKITTKQINKLLEPIKKTVEHPGFILIDTPGHEPFDSMRKTAIDIADYVIVVVNIKKGVEEITASIIKYIKEYKKPFIIAVNMVDLIDGWHHEEGAISMKTKAVRTRQSRIVQDDLKKYMNQLIAGFAMYEINVCDFNDEQDPKEWTYAVPLSAKTMEGVSELIYYMCKIQTKFMVKKLTYDEFKIKAHIMNIDDDVHHGRNLRVILSNGKLCINDSIMCDTYDGVQIFKIKQLMIPDDLKEMKDKMIFSSVDEAEGACACMVKGDIPKNIISGSKIFKIDESDEKDIEDKKDKLIKEHEKQLKLIDEYKLDEIGVHLHAGNFGTLDALINLTNKYKIQISGITIGTLKKEDIIKSTKAMRMAGDDKLAQLNACLYNVIFMFGGVLHADIEEYAKENKVKIIKEDVIYNIIKRYTKLNEVIKNKFKELYPQIQPLTKFNLVNGECIFNTYNPLVLGVHIGRYNHKKINRFTGMEEMVPHNLYIGSLVRAVKEGEKPLYLGRITSIEINNSPVPVGKEGEKFCIKIEQFDGLSNYVCHKTIGKGDFDETWSYETYYSPQLELIYKKYTDLFDG